MKKSFSIFLLLFVHWAYGQKYVDLARVYYSNSAQNNFENSDSSTRVMEFGVDLTGPIVINDKRVILTGLFYEQTQAKLYPDQPEQAMNILGLRAGISITHSDTWTGSYILVPKIASDFNSIDGNDFQIGAIALLKYNKQENMNYKLGMYYNAEFFGPLFIPLFGLYYQSANKKFETNLTLPFQADANYQLNKHLHTGMNFNGQVRSFRLSEIPERSTEGYVVKSANELFSYLRINLTRQLLVHLKAGYTLGRSYRVFEEGDKVSFASILVRVGDDRTQLNTDFSDGFVYQAGLVFRFTSQ